MRSRPTVATLCRGARHGLAVGALGALGLVGMASLYFYDGGSEDHTYLRVGDCWDYSTRFNERVHLKPCSGPHFGEVILDAPWPGTTARADFCEQRLNTILSKNSGLLPYTIPASTIRCAVTSAEHSETRTGRVDR
ncbi:hypothetical protein ACIA8C_39195 [Nocardia sp. NPDC051321]|uniref:hypothetical protein n=1 Tax=Nocardia sp. NPDC051321 TaxID=3364323 RepID=UPI0037AAAD4C